MSTSIKQVEPLGAPWKAQDPFMFCAYHLDQYPAGNDKLGLNPDQMRGRNIGQDFTLKDGYRMYHGSMVPGFPYHPHSGFETITINVQGVIDHSDSLGGAGRFRAGDVQWMTAGKGIQHSEMFPLVNKDQGNTLEIFQIWLNLPKKSKQVPPHYKMLWREDIPVVRKTDAAGRITAVSLIAGALDGIKAPAPNPDSWAMDPANGVSVLMIDMEPGATWTMPDTELAVHRNLYFYRGGSITSEGRTIGVNSRIILDPSKPTTLVNGDQRSSLILLQGKPINEPVAQYGPFVANTDQEIRQTIAEYQRTQFGGWPWPMKEQVFERTRKRFARFDDGTEVERE